MKLTEISISEKDLYNRFVQNNEAGSFLQSWEWGEWQSALGRSVYRFMMVDDSGVQIASMQLIKTPLPFGRYYLYAPYGPVLEQASKFHPPTGGPIFNFQKLLQTQFPDALFVRIEPQVPIALIFNSGGAGSRSAGPKFLIKSTNIQPAKTLVVDVQKTNEELLAAMHPKTRYNIKVAERNGVEIKSEILVEAGNANTKAVVDLIVQTQERQNYRGHAAAYYTKLLDFFTASNASSDLKVTIYSAWYQNKLLVAAIMFDFGKTRVYLYGGSSDEHKNVMAPYLLHWKALQDARDLGINFYDLGGSEASARGEQGFTRFKQGFGGRLVEYSGAFDVVNNSVLYSIYGIMRKVNKLLQKLK